MAETARLLILELHQIHARFLPANEFKSLLIDRYCRGIITKLEVQYFFSTYDLAEV